MGILLTWLELFLGAFFFFYNLSFLILKYILIFEAIVNGVIFLIYVSDSLFSVYRNTKDFY